MLGLTQSAITKSIRVLEADLSVPLVERTSSGSTLTNFGRQLLNHARAIRNEVAAANQNIRDMASQPGGLVRLGCAGAASSTLLPITIPFFRSRFPTVDVVVTAGMTARLMPQLLDGSLDLVIGSDTSVLPPSIQRTPLFWSESCVIVRTGHRLADSKSILQFSDCRWVLTNELANVTSPLRQAFAAVGVDDIDVMVRTDDPFLTDRLVASTDVVSVMRVDMLRTNMLGDGITTLNMKGLAFRDEIVLFTKRSNRSDHYAQRFSEALVTHADALKQERP